MFGKTEETSASIEASPSGETRIKFSGFFAPEIRDHFKARRLELGISFKQLGDVLNIHSSTIRKWEEGQTNYCHTKYISRVQHFLRGDYDRKIQMMFGGRNEVQNLWHGLPHQMHLCMENAARIYGLCNTHPEVSCHLLSNLNEAVNSTIRQLLGENGDHDSAPQDSDLPQST